MSGLSRTIGRLRTAMHRGSVDAELVRAFVAAGDEAAFAHLVRRHGPLVFGVCRRVFAPAADDSFQATFLLLALRAGRLRDPAGVAGWLHGVAVRTSREAKAAAYRRREVERLAARPEPAPPPPDAETLALLDAAVAALPARYRAAVVLCDLADKSRAEAAAELGVPEGTVASRLARGRRRLAVALAGKGLAVALVAPPPALAALTVRTAVLLAAGGVPPPAVHLLITGVTRAMRASLLKPVLVAGLGVLGGAGAWGLAAGDGPPPAPPPAKAPVETPAERWAKLKAEYDAERAANTKPALDPATGQPRIPRSFEVRQVPADTYAVRLLELGRCDDPDTAAAALTLGAFEFPTTKLSDDSFELLLDRFGEGPRLAEFARGQIGHGYTGDHHRAQRLLGVSTDPYVRAYSLLKLAFHYQHEPGPEAKARALALLRRVATDYPQVDDGHPARWAARELKATDRLRAGMPARPITGPDLDGNVMALDQFRGQVVALYVGSVGNVDTVENHPWLVEVAGKYADRGVLVLGLLETWSLDDAKKEWAKHPTPWRTWPDLQDRATGIGPVVADWGITTHPAVILIDRAGVIRDPLLRSKAELTAALDKLLAEPGK